MRRPALLLALLLGGPALADTPDGGEPARDPFPAQAVKIWVSTHPAPNAAIDFADRRDCLQKIQKKELAEAGAACGAYGLTLLEKDPKEARRMLAIGCEQEGAEFCLMGGYLAEIVGDFAEAEKRHASLCDKNAGGVHEGPACGRVGLLIANRDPLAARRYFERGCAKDGWSCLWFGELLEKGGDLAGAEGRFADACKRGARQGCEKRDARALMRLDRSCKEGEARACVEYGARLVRASRAAEAIPVAAPLCAKEARPREACLVLAAAELEGGKREAGRQRYVALCERGKVKEVCEQLADAADGEGEERDQRRWTQLGAKATALCDGGGSEVCELLERLK
jgi:hypothetical protein